ncbi:restriction endonuclease [Helicobacter saguini]|uniref:Restriction endonuclease n=1 Tax=Helicobacter saguini TaxID=1548018 RepID=A0A347VQ57_9HELI|nr:McrC family protein [Helicobacter saguini]MWV61068.1 restriction endonuclease [Helicobacter saguini]MWV68263.1 restriction endonuclease [Helicobacter saguini]MWV70273.1 restriction endonuclease [Helicobacter saguini]MWV72175.1 restriction endonuclease [Helicobacter saguini]TLD95234.1 restriction endonuclease [Helicobacter saguini]
MKTLSILEHQKFGISNIKSALKIDSKDSDSKIQTKATKYFSELCDFAMGKDNHNFLRFYGKHALRAQKYVGLIQTKSGFCVEILPKIFKNDLKDSNAESKEKIKIDSKKYREKIQKNAEKFTNYITTDSEKPPTYESIFKDSQEKLSTEQQSRILLFNILKTLKKTPFKDSNFANLHTQNMNILEIFVNMFLDSLDSLIKRGVKHDYINIESNKKFLKGKLLFAQNLRENLIHKERFYTQSDEFSNDIAINRLIISTLKVLNNLTLSGKTSTRLNKMRFILQDINESKNLSKDFAIAHSQMRNLKLHAKEYESLYAWCKIFLKRESFSTYSGDSIAFALLFDMNKLFEYFVTFYVKKHAPNAKAQTTQKKMLIDSNNNETFTLKPDIVIESNSQILILDTKWKNIKSNEISKAISSADLYQIWAYASKYAISHIVKGRRVGDRKTDSKDSKKEVKTFLIYPQTENNKESTLQNQTHYFKASLKDSKNTISLQLAFFPLF